MKEIGELSWKLPPSEMSCQNFRIYFGGARKPASARNLVTREYNYVSWCIKEQETTEDGMARLQS